MNTSLCSNNQNYLCVIIKPYIHIILINNKSTYVIITVTERERETDLKANDGHVVGNLTKNMDKEKESNINMNCSNIPASKATR